MTQDVSNLVSLFSGVGGLEGLQMTETGELGATDGFSEALLEQIKLLREQGELPENLEGLAELQNLSSTNEGGKLQEFAGLLNNFGKQGTSPVDSGNKLPQTGELEKLNNIDEAIDSLHGVMQQIAQVTDVVEEAAAEVGDAIEQFVEYLKGDDQSEGIKEQQEQVVASINMAASANIPAEPNKTPNENWVEDTLLSAESLVQDKSLLSNTVSDQKNVQQVFSKEFEKLSSTSSIVGTPAVSTGEQAESIPAVTDPSQEFLDDMLENDQGKFKSVQETAVLDNLKEESFNMSLTNSLDKSVVNNIGPDISILNRQMASMSAATKSELPAMTQAFNHPEWQNEFNERIVWMNNKSISAAELKINPQHLGPVSIRIDMNQDQATIGFTAQHASVREAIEAAIPKLREMLNGQQLNLAEVNVSQHDFSEQRQQAQNFFQGGQKQNNPQGEAFTLDESNREAIETALDLTEEIERGRAVASNGLLNTYV